MSPYRSDRRLAGRYRVRTPLRVRLWKSAVPECAGESVNLSQRGIYFETDEPIRAGETVEVLFYMPEEIVGEPESEWRCTGHVVRVEDLEGPGGKQGVGVQFDCYEISRSTPGDLPVGTETPMRMLRDVAPNGNRIRYEDRRDLSTMSRLNVSRSSSGDGALVKSCCEEAGVPALTITKQLIQKLLTNGHE